MWKEIFEHVELMNTCGRAKKPSRLRDILSTLEDQVITFEESMGDVKERVNDKITDGRDDALEAMIRTLKDEIAELKGELIIYNAALSSEGLAAIAPQPIVDVPNPKEFKGARSTDVRRGRIEIGTWEEFQSTVMKYVRELNKLMLQISDMGEKKKFTKAMTVAESLAKFDGKKDQPESSKLKFKPKGNRGGNQDKPTKNDNGKKP
ncbi:hypothetical protein Goari_002524 [Gossypium aridum]|uniref:Uncharacterized protein n=1 Tax=Gossypium aridum TaxID=34290 RepID=A0A7J8Y8Q8_GOSAI|nr:hypothetical protein [Gossypium aridum]